MPVSSRPGATRKRRLFGFAAGHVLAALLHPDQFRRDRTVVLDYSYPADCGYSSWTQLPDGKIVIVDYTTGGDLESFSWGAVGRGTSPFIRAYHVTERDLVRP